MEENKASVSAVPAPAGEQVVPPTTVLAAQHPSVWKLPFFLVAAVLVLVGGFLFYSYTKKINSPASSVTQSNDAKEAGTLVVGENTDEDGVEADTKEFQPFVDYLGNQLKDQGIKKVKFVSTKSVSEMASMVRAGKIDIVVDSAFPIYVVDKLTGAKPLAIRWKGGVQTYHTVIFVKQSSTLQTLDDLKGKMISFDGPTSTVGYFLPKALLLQKGYTLTEKNSPSDPVGPNEIGYFFAHANVFSNVAGDVTPAGAESELEVKSFFGDKIGDYRYLLTAPDVPRFLVAVRPGLDPVLQNRLKEVLTAMDQSEAGKSVLKDFAESAKFSAIETSDTLYGVLKDLSNFVEDEIVRQ